jgi:hypothetical protein
LGDAAEVDNGRPQQMMRRTTYLIWHIVFRFIVPSNNIAATREIVDVMVDLLFGNSIQSLVGH